MLDGTRPFWRNHVNQDFLLPSKANVARRLVKLSKIMDINLDPEIIKFAETDLLSKDDYTLDLNPSQHDAVQSLLDYDLRAVFPAGKEGVHPINQATITLVAALVAKVSPIFVLTIVPEHWTKLAAHMGLELIHLNEGSERGKAIDPDLFRYRRDGLLIIEGLQYVDCGFLAMDFSKTIIMTSHRLLTDVSSEVASLFPNAPYDILTNNNPYFRKKIEQMGFKSTRLEDLAFLLNVVTDLLPDYNNDTTEKLKYNIALSIQH
jgi:hypothetical protein